ncbi:hypothetical protein M6D81_00280 [Paenibacillus sp. J5C_2022]|uniref:hypothetical protein n=1 Tax=Paenibacillus sp. J5C2022 TaxID=2977129 RepID=UPI0021D334EA|nr:hypothetical protein [Paenibacillus sp. J5C2022]MCU6707127.1 hypothetical protein [Paenibacillus sp. J5C2022]
MLGSWRWNIGFGLLGALLIIVFSMNSNPMSVVLLRSLYAFVSFFVLAFAARAALAAILKPPAIADDAEDRQDDGGSQLDLVTPDESGDLNDMLKAQLQGDADKPGKANAQDAQATDFKPLNPPQFVSADDKQPEHLAKALRHLTGE